MSKKMIEEIIKALVMIPGLLGFSNIDMDKSNKTLSENELDKGIKIEEFGTKTTLSIAIVIESDINAKMISKEVNTTIKQTFKKNDLKVSEIKIFIRGIR